MDERLNETKLEIRALADSWLFAFTAPPNNTEIREDSYRILKLTLYTQSQKGFIKEPSVILLRQIFAWKPQDRPSAADALTYEVWKPIRDERVRESWIAETEADRNDERS